MMRKKSLKPTRGQDEKRLQIILRFLIIAFILVTIGITLIMWVMFTKDLYKAFVLDFIGTSFLFAAGLTICFFFLYLFFVITVLNPQRIKMASVIKFAFGGIFTLIITLFLLNSFVTFIFNSTKDMNSYTNGEWQMKELLVTDVYKSSRGSRGTRGLRSTKTVLIHTSEGEMTLYWESFRIYKGKEYRFTYLDATNTIIKVEEVID